MNITTSLIMATKNLDMSSSGRNHGSPGRDGKSFRQEIRGHEESASRFRSFWREIFDARHDGHDPQHRPHR